MNTTHVCPQPIHKMAALLARMLAAFPEIHLSITALTLWCAEQIQLQRRWSAETKAIDDPLERDHALIVEALKNDPPAVRRRILADLREVHRRTEVTAGEIAPLCPPANINPSNAAAGQEAP